jgi:hypothetical protein
MISSSFLFFCPVRGFLRFVHYTGFVSQGTRSALVSLTIPGSALGRRTVQTFNPRGERTMGIAEEDLRLIVEIASHVGESFPLTAVGPWR